MPNLQDLMAAAERAGVDPGSVQGGLSKMQGMPQGGGMPSAPQMDAGGGAGGLMDLIQKGMGTPQGQAILSAITGAMGSGGGPANMGQVDLPQGGGDEGGYQPNVGAPGAPGQAIMGAYLNRNKGAPSTEDELGMVQKQMSGGVGQELDPHEVIDMEKKGLDPENPKDVKKYFDALDDGRLNRGGDELDNDLDGD
jgi:hypothetical protein